MAADGEPPDSVVAWGLYVEGVRQDGDDLDLAAQRAMAGEGFVWLGLKDPSDEDMAGFAERFNLHPLAIEDAVEGHTRSKLEEFGDTLFCVISTVAYVEHAELTDSSEIVSTGQIMVFVGKNFVMTVRRGEHAQLQEMRARLEAKPQRLAHGTYEVLYAVLDKVIEDYITVVAEFETDIEEVETAVFSRWRVALLGTACPSSWYSHSGEAEPALVDVVSRRRQGITPSSLRLLGRGRCGVFACRSDRG